MRSGKGKKPTRYGDFLAKSIAKESQSKPTNVSSVESKTARAALFTSSSNPVQRILKEENDRGVSSDYDLNVMATALLDREAGQLPMIPSDESALFKNLTDVLGETASHLSETPENDGDSGLVDRFENLEVTSVFAKKALKTAHRLEDVLVEVGRRLEGLSEDTPPETIHSILHSVEPSLAYVSRQAGNIKNPAAATQVAGVLKKLETMEITWNLWRKRYPDVSSPIKIDNRDTFVDLSNRWNTPTMIAYTIALVSRIFEGAARRASSTLLKLLKVYGLSVTLLAGGPNLIQQKALNDIPESIGTLEKRLNLQVPSIPHAVCPSCSYTYPPTYAKGSQKPIYPTRCTERLTETAEPCGTHLLSEGKPIKTYHYYSFYEWFGRFIAQPKIEKYGDEFCNDVTALQREDPSEGMRSFKDGTFVRTFSAEDGKLFIEGRGNEGRWLFLLHADFFNVEGNRVRGKTRSTGVTCLACLNLPLSMRYDSAWLYIPGIIQGPHEPNAKNSENRHYWRLMVTELLAGYSRGLKPHHTYQTYQMGLASNERIHRVAIGGASLDFKAARPFGGFLDVTSHHTCFVCKCWHLAHIGRTDHTKWEPADIEFLKRGAFAWINAKTSDERSEIESFYGTRYSELWRLPYWDPTRQLLVEPMHTIFLILLQRFARDALGLDNPGPLNMEDDDNHDSGDATEKKKKSKAIYICYYYNFTPPPHPSVLTPLGHTPVTSSSQLRDNIQILISEPLPKDQQLSIVDWNDITAHERAARLSRKRVLLPLIEIDPRAFQGIHDLHELLSLPAPSTELEKKAFQKQLSNHKWHVLAYVCNDLMEFPIDRAQKLKSQSSISKRDVTKRMFAAALAEWHDLHENYTQFNNLHTLTLQDRFEVLAQLTKQLNLHSEFEGTMSQAFCKGAAFRRWLMRPDCPDLLKFCAYLLDKAYGYDKRSEMSQDNEPSWDDEAAEDDEHQNEEDLNVFHTNELIKNKGSCTPLSNTNTRQQASVKLPTKLAQKIGNPTPTCYLQVPAPKGFYGTDKSIAIGNSYVCYRPKDGSTGEWVVGQIRYIFDLKGVTNMAIVRSKPFVAPISDPFAEYVIAGFEARTISSYFSQDYDVVAMDSILGHAARWELSSDVAVVLCLSRE
ncbi:serine threonine protein kinase [Lentinula edodes]|uniref:Serine threonine protein kinase n=1 Tax=Lentinula edodes TaxID=5353 RepID=A0A1Q3EK92_LENED|nr:serine threonine protein kinase [Lentinula edodes]